MRPSTALLSFLPLIVAIWVPRQADSPVQPSASPAIAEAADLSPDESTGILGGKTLIPGGPRITIHPYNGPAKGVTLTGVRTANLGIDAYLGIPFAAPPVGALRFTPPRNYTWTTSRFTATSQPRACLQPPSEMYGTRGFSEDCLQLNVFTPQGTNDSSASLPVYVWVYGGGFATGAANVYDPSLLNAAGIQSNRPFITVVINYRLGFLGWPYGKEIAKNGAANLGLKDVIASLQWVKENIRAFGGDPSRVTVGGQSAGAVAISLLYLHPDLDLFRSAIIQSGGTSTAPIAPTDGAWEDVYGLIAASTGCNITVATSPFSPVTDRPKKFKSSFECLKAVPADKLLAAQIAVQSDFRYGTGFIFAPSIDYDLIPDSPHALIAAGDFARKPMINGNVRDEGTIFVPQGIASGQIPLLLGALEPVMPSDATFLRLLQLYPDIPSLGSPYLTGGQTFGLSSGYKQASSIVGDVAFQANRRWLVRNSKIHHPDIGIYTYFFNQTTPDTPAPLGVYHGSDVAHIFGFTMFGNYTAEDRQVTTAMMNYWINFIHNQNPNDADGLTAVDWPEYGGDARNMLQLQAGNISAITDDYREENIAFLNSEPDEFNFRKRSYRT